LSGRLWSSISNSKFRKLLLGFAFK
jgi:hypothetical protein